MIIPISVFTLTTLGSIHPLIEMVKDKTIELADKGFKVDYKSMFKEKLKEKDYEFFVSSLPLAVPIVNMIYSGILISSIKDDYRSYVNDYLIPLNKKEKEEYKNKKSTKEKLNFLKTIKREEEKKEIIEVEKAPRQEKIIYELKRDYIEYEPLKGTYTLEEVKRLNQTTGYLYQVGKIDDIPVAIIGNYNLTGREDHKVRIMETLTEDGEILEKKFAPENELYRNPDNYIIYTMTKNEELESCLRQIRKEKIDKLKDSKEHLIELLNYKYELDDEIKKQQTKKRKN